MTHAHSRQRTQRRRRHSQRGTVALEFLIVLLPLLVGFFGVAQYALLQSARLVVEHATSRAARAAIVLLDDDPEHHDGAARGDLTSGDGAISARTALRLLPGIGGELEIQELEGGARLAALRNAALSPLSILAPDLRKLQSQPSLSSATRGSLLDLAGGLLIYGPAAAAVTLRSGPLSKEIVTHVGPRDSVTVHVSFLFPCRVPIASRFLCQSAHDLLGLGTMKEDLVRSLDGLRNRAPSSLLAAGSQLKQARQRMKTRLQDAHDLSLVAAPPLQALLLLSGLRFSVIEAETTLPNQGAGYHRKSTP